MPSGQGAEFGERDGVIGTELRCPFGESGETRADRLAAIEFDGMGLAVVEPDGLDLVIARERPGETDRRVLSAGEEHECPRVRRFSHCLSLRSGVLNRSRSPPSSGQRKAPEKRAFPGPCSSLLTSDQNE